VQGFGWRQPLGILSVEIDHQADNGFVYEVAVANTQSANLNQPDQRRRRADDELALFALKMDTVIAHQHGRRDLPGAAGQDEIECET